MNNTEIRNYIKGFKKNINSKTSTEVLLTIKKEIDDICDTHKLSGATLLFLHKIKANLKTSIKKSKRFENLSLSYFETKGIKPSPAEELIINVLNKLNINYYKEVSFNGFTTNKGYYYRYDFYIPSKNLIIEYDGKLYHDNQTNDKIKNKFCLDNKIRLVRLNAKHYHNLDSEIKKLLK